MKVCDNASVGVLLFDDDDRLLMFERATPPIGVAPPAGHVFDEHGTRDDLDQAYLDAARAEVSEEVGLTVTSLHMVIDRWVGNRCRRTTPSGRVGHRWRVFRGQATGDLAPSERETRNARWLAPLEVQHLADRTVAWARGTVSDAEFAERPGLEPVWVWWLASLRLVMVDDPDLLRVLARAEHGSRDGA